MSASYPPVGTRVRWVNRGVVREGVVVLLDRGFAKGSTLAFHFYEVFGWPPRPWSDKQDRRYREVAEVVAVDTVDGKPNEGRRRYYHPRPQWLEVLEPAEPPGEEPAC